MLCPCVCTNKPVSLPPYLQRQMQDHLLSSGFGNVPSVKELMASFRCGFCARYFSVTSGSPSLIMRCTMIMLL
jgi:hypothetical protein